MANVSPLRPDDLNSQRSLRRPQEPATRAGHSQPPAHDHTERGPDEDRVELSEAARRRGDLKGSAIAQVNELIRQRDTDHDRKLSTSELGIDSIQIQQGRGREPVTVPVTTSGSPAQLIFSLTTGSGISQNVSIRLGGTGGTQAFSFASSTRLSAMAAGLNGSTLATGVSARASGGSLILSSIKTGSRAFVSVEPIAGSFMGQTAGSILRDNGEDGHLLSSVDRNGDGELSRSELLQAYRAVVGESKKPGVSETV